MTTLILYNGKIHAKQPATAVALKDRKILAVGNDDDIKALATTKTRQIDLAGRLVLPGLHDGHFHFYNWAEGRNDLDLAKSNSLDNLLAQLRRRVRQTKPGRWIKGYGWNESEWPVPEMPTRHNLDLVSPQNPVILWRADFHAAVVNSAALNAAKITAHTPSPGGVIQQDANGQPTGILKELAIDLVRQHIPPLPQAELLPAMKKSIADLHKLGITGLHDQRLMSGDDGPLALRAYQQLRQNKDLTLRLTTNIHHTQLPHAIELGLKSGFGDDILRFGFVKVFSDGSMGAHTAWMLQPYEDGGLGMPATPPKEIAKIVRLAEENGWPVSIHAIGDRANREVLDIFEEVAAQKSGKPSLPMPHRIEHAQTLHPADAPRLAKLGLTASMQPIHLLDDMVLLNRILGERGNRAYVFGDLLAAGTVLAFGSDCPIASPNPWLGIHAAVNRRQPSGEPEAGWYPAQRISVAQALWGYTMGNAIAAGQQERLGSITPDKLADLIVVNQDIFEVDPVALAETTVVMTIFDGQVVFEAG